MQPNPEYVKSARKLAQNGQINISTHARQRMNERSVSVSTAVDTIINNECIRQEPPGTDLQGQTYVSDRLCFIDRNNKLEVIVALCIPLTIVTVYYYQ